MYLIRVMVADFYMSPAIPGLDNISSELRPNTNSQVPIIRIFGPSETGEKTCLHIHGVFPYFYIPSDEENPSTTTINQITKELDLAINTSLGQSCSNVSHVYKISVVHGIPFYGYHKREHVFLKIYFYNPLIIKKACTVLQNGSVLGKIFQPHEAHLPFVLQFMVDYNIHGMSFLSLSEVWYRRGSSSFNSDFLLPANVSKISISNVEIDSLAENIVNRAEIQKGNLGTNPGINALWEDEKQRRRNKGISSQLSNFLTQTRRNLPPTSTHLTFQNLLKERLKTVKTSNDSQININNLVYPTESFQMNDSLNLSSLEFHSSQTSILDVSQSSFLDDTLNNDLLNVLNDLNKANQETEMENDAILTQITEDDNDDEFNFDFTLNTTPEKIIDKEIDNLMQIDGANDSSDSSESESNEYKRACAYTSASKPFLSEIPCAHAQDESYDLNRGFVPLPGTSTSTQAPSVELNQGSNAFTPKLPPPSYDLVKETLREFQIPEVRYRQPFFANPKDVSSGLEVGVNCLKVPTLTVRDLKEFKDNSLFDFRKNCEGFTKLAYVGNHEAFITPVRPPPSKSDLISWLDVKKTTKKERKKHRVVVISSQNSNEEELSISPSPVEDITSPVLGSRRKQMNIDDSLRKNLLQSQFLHSKFNDSYAISGSSNQTQTFRISLENLQRVKAILDHQYLTVLIMELHVNTRGDLQPDPEFDSIEAIFYSVHNDVPKDTSWKEQTGILAISREFSLNETKIRFFKDEIELINQFIALFLEWDPDILIGYEIEMLSWGYLIERSNYLSLNLMNTMSRSTVGLKRSNDDDLQLTGRILLNLWRLLKHELALQSYTYENVLENVLHYRTPFYTCAQLNLWWRSVKDMRKTASYYLERVQGQWELIDHLDLLGCNSELARLFGIQFYEVLSRGSQFRVESMMFRLMKPLNFIAVSPSVEQRARMCAPEGLPLILEPESKFYTDPVIVLDFQSLYPSIIIAYNYCFSTCLGNIKLLGQEGPFQFGTTQLKVPSSTLRGLVKKDLINYSPCGVGFVKSKVRCGILPRMLEEILDTRLMVKSSMKEYKNDEALKRVLHSRQLGLKLIANVTYGYTSANFSGRMPAVELGDSIISKARETLLRAIKLVENNSKWNVRVIYGDTDSLFVLVEGRSRDEAFRIGSEIANAVTDDNPSPIKLKLEKVFHPCLLQTKKRYVGFMYESREQKEAEFCAKGIETVRRDGCPALSKILEKSLKILFETKDVSKIRLYVLRQFRKIFSARVSLQDLTFAKEYRGMSNYRPGACVPALELAKKWRTLDRRKEPRKGERVPYVIIAGHPGLPLIKLVRSPRELIADPSLHPNAVYYITKVIIPALNRCFLLIGIDLHVWFNTMPRKQIQYLPSVTPSSSKKSTISQYFSMSKCANCGQAITEKICGKCKSNPQRTFANLQQQIALWEQQHCDLIKICQSCSRNKEINCISLDCPIYYKRIQCDREVKQTPFLHAILRETFDIE